MAKSNAFLGGEQGMILSSSMLLISALIILGVAAGIMSQSGYKILANLKTSTEAFYVAEAGLAWSREQLGRATQHPPAPAGRSQDFMSGNFSVSFSSPIAVTPLTAKITVQSTGTVGTSSRLVRAQLSKTYDLADGAIALRGNVSGADFSGDPVLLSGLDHDPGSGAPIPGAKSALTISVPDESLRNFMEDVLASSEPGPSLEYGGEGSGVAESSYLSPSFLSQFANNLCGSVSAMRSTVPSEAILSVNDQQWGDQASPQLRCIDGLPEPGDVVDIAGNLAGAGILVVRDADLVISGSFRWQGLLIVTGSDIAFKAAGPETKDIYGSLLVNETGLPRSGRAHLDLRGRIKAVFSRPALTQAATLIPAFALESNYDALPYSISQDFWQTVSP